MKYETPELHPLTAPMGAIQGTIDMAIQQIQESIAGDPREALSGSVWSHGVCMKEPDHFDFPLASCNFRNLCQRVYCSALAGSGSS